MKRIECECGRMVRVDRETEDGEGDRGICPYCGAKLAVPADKKSAPQEEDAAEDKPPSPSILAAAGLVVLLLVGGGLAAFFYFKKPEAAKDVASNKPATEPITEYEKPSAKTPKKATPEPRDPLAGPFAVRLEAPRKKGDLREVGLKGTTKTRFTVVESGTPERGPSKTTQFELVCKIRTLDVDQAGQEKAWEITIEAIGMQGAGATKTPPAGTVLKAELPMGLNQGELVFSGTGVRTI